MDGPEAVLITGYKPYELGIHAADHPGIPVIRYCLKNHIRRLAENGTHWFVISGSPGVELWAADACLELKKEGRQPTFQLAVLVPFLNQEDRYKGWIRQQYDHILDSADFAAAITRRPYDNPGQLRLKNDFLVSKTDALLILYDEETPGSPQYMLKTAQTKADHVRYPIMTIDRYDIERAAEDLRQQDPDHWM